MIAGTPWGAGRSRAVVPSRRDDWNRATPSFASHTGRFGGTMQGDDGGGAGHAAVPRRPASAKPKSAISRRKAGWA